MRTAKDGRDDLVQILCNRVIAQIEEIRALQALLADIVLGFPLTPTEEQMVDQIIKRKDR